MTTPFPTHTQQRAARAVRHVRSLALLLALGAAGVSYAVSLDDQPVLAARSVPGNLALALSVEWPTTSRTAHTGAYTNTTEFLGYHDPDKCYRYQYNSATPAESYFAPAGLATGTGTANPRRCTDNLTWSGNFLNWAATSTIDPFRWAMTGGRRVVDTATETILEKARHARSSLFNDRTLPNNQVENATPFTAAQAPDGLGISVQNRGYQMRFWPVNRVGPFTVEYYNATANNYDVFGNGTAPVRTDTGVQAPNNQWGDSPATGVNADFSSRWTSQLNWPAQGYFQFRLKHDDRARLLINGAQVADGPSWTDWNNDALWTYSSRLGRTTNGASATVEVQHVDTGGGASLRVQVRRCNNNPNAGNADSATIGTGCRTDTNGQWGAWQDLGATTPNNYLPGTSAVNYQDAALGPNFYDATMRVKVCDASTGAGGVEANCKAYGSNYKPEGLIQEYSDRMRFSAFGYLNDDNMRRDGGVMRARQKFVGPQTPVPGSLPITNTASEWSATTGQYVRNPDGTDATATNTLAGLSGGDAVQDSGVINYVNKFGSVVTSDYKDHDPVSEMYYGVLRYFRNLGNVPAWSSMTPAHDSNPSVATKRAWVDGFPVITNWDDPIQYSCQRNFILGIGDIYTHRDKNVPGNARTGDEPAMPAQVTADTAVNAVTLTNRVQVLQGLSPGRDGNYSSGRENSYYMAGLAFDANTRDQRPDVAGQERTRGKQTVQTYWVDVLEAAFESNNQFYLAAKFGGLDQNKLPAGFDPLTYNGTIPLDWFSTSGETVGTQPRPDNYYTAGQPAAMVSGLQRAFARIANNIKEFTTSFSLSAPQVQSSGAASYATQYDTSDWTSEITGSTLKFVNAAGNPDPGGDPQVVTPPSWNTTATLATQFGGAGWNTGRRVATWNPTLTGVNRGVPFRWDNISSTQRTALNNVSGTEDANRQNLLNYLRGDRANEKNSTNTTRPFRQRGKLLGDIVNAKLRPVGPPSRPLSDAANQGYSAFKTLRKDRPTVVYAGANDGMLHAINGKLDTATGGGQEMFAYVPSALFNGPSSTPLANGLAALADPNYVHHFYVDGTPAVYDLDFGRVRTNHTTAWRGGAPYTPDWRSLLIGGLGKGGRSYYALDVSNPANNTEANTSSWVLWEFSDTDMGFSYGEPLVVKTRRYGWVVILTSGYHDDNTNRQGYFYIVDPKTGDLLQKIGTGTGTTANGLAHAEAFVKDYSDGMADAVYAGDLNGQLWRLDLSGETADYAAPTRLAVLTNAAGQAQPITTKPLIEIHPQTLKRYVMVGTGQLLNGDDVASASAQGYYAILDGTQSAFTPYNAGTMPYTRANFVQRAANNFTNGVTLSNTDRGWYIDLDVVSSVALRVVAPSTAYNGRVAFSALLPAGDVCSPQGTSRIYALDFSTGRSVLKSDVTNTIVAYVATDSAITDLRFLSVDGRAKLLSGDNKGKVEDRELEPPPRPPVRLLNWREVPTAN